MIRIDTVVEGIIGVSIKSVSINISIYNIVFAK